MQYAVAGWPIAGHSESPTDRLTRWFRSGWKTVIDFLTQPGTP